MLKIAPARRPNGSLRLRIVSIIILIALISPIANFDGLLIAEASGPQNSIPTAPVNAAPPESFATPGAGWSLRTTLLGALFSIAAPGAETEPRIEPDVSGLDVAGKQLVHLSRLVDADPIEEAAPAPPPPAAPVDFDFDGDGRTDISRWHPQTAEYRILNSNGGTYSTWTVGSAGERPAPADFDGDGKTDAATFSAGTWTYRRSSDGTTATITGFGQAGDIPLPGNYRGSSTSAEELAVYRPSDGGWYWREVGSSTVYSMQYGVSTDIPAPGDYDGDGDVEPAVYRQSTGWWWVSSIGGFPWGNEMDYPVAADFDGDGKTDPTVFRAYQGTWYALHSSTGYTTYSADTWGNYGDQPVAGYFDADAKADFAVWRPTSGRWYVKRSTDAGETTETLGVPGDTAVPSSYIHQFGGQIAPDVINKERLKPRNATGGTDPYPQNFAWGRNLVSLPGRSGTDLNIGVSYNSLVWTKLGGAMLFDADANADVVSAGFRVEPAPAIEPAYYDDDTDRFNYLMVAPDGSRREFRQTGVSNVYETHDSSYARLVTTGAASPLDPVEDISIAVTTADGTRSDYDWIAGAFRCTKRTDRNGNFITIGYDAYGFGLVAAVTDTLGRVVNFNYDSALNLSDITQTWKEGNGSGGNTTHTYATFTYTTKTISTDFDSSLTVYGPPSGMVLKVLDKITYADGSSTKFHHNGYAQVWKIENVAADSSTHVLNRVRTDLESPAADQTDCPRFTQVKQFVENFNGGNETTTDITRTAGQSYTSPAGGSAVTATKVEVAMSGHPHNLVSKRWYQEGGWKDGLPFATEDWADGTGGSERKRWTLTAYTQDDTGASYTTNPRVTETKVGDGTNTKRTTIDYVLYDSSTIAAFGLPATVKVYDADQATVLKQIDTAYNFDANYISRRIAGLPVEVEMQGRNQLSGNLELVSRVTYGYDEGGFSDSSLQQNISPDVGHDNTNFGSSFAYRGNLTSTTRWDVTAPTNGSAAITTATLKYNTAGSVVAKTTPWDGTNTRTVRIGYSDNFNSTPGVTTYAYPTVMTDPAGSSLGASGHSSTVKYRYDIGANVEATSPAPANQTYGKTTKRIFDSIGRLERDSVYVNTTEHSYVRYEYPTNAVQSKMYRPIVDQDGDGNLAEDEVYSESWFDGAGRPRMSRSEHPGSTGGWAATFVEYDVLGRVKRQSVPTETNSSFAPAGDDAAGALWQHFKYDWMGRVVRKINTDGVDQSTLNDSDVLISYQGCGCAGGLVTTVEGELVPRTDTTGNARRKTKTYADILGRTFKTETYEWDGTTVYSTVVQTFDGADRAVRSRQYAGAESSTAYQDTTASFDGHGRLYQSLRPEQRDSSNNPTHTTLAYNPDDSLHVRTDARGATSSYTYDPRGLVTNVANEWASPPPPPRVNFALPANGATATASSVYSANFPVAGAFNGDRAGIGWGSGGGGWSDGTSNSYPDWLQVDFGEERTIDEVAVATVQDNYTSPTEPTGSMTFSQYGIRDFHLEYWDGDSWEAISGAGVTNNNKVLKTFTFSPVSTSKVRLVVTDALYQLSRVTEFEAWGPDETAPPVETTASFTYDDLGNRTGMTDDNGSTIYSYDPLSRLVDETRSYTDALPNAPLPNNSFKIEYGYNISGSLKSITDPFGDEIEYASDKAGRLNAVTGSSYANVTEYAEGAAYTAWGGLKSLQYGNGVQSSTTYNNRLLPTTYELSGPSSTPIMDKSYQYYSDGRLRFVDDPLNGVFDRLQTYDHAGRIKAGKSGAEASGSTVAAEDRSTQLPYRQGYSFDAFGNMTGRTNMHWGVENWQGRSNDLSYTYADNRVAGWTYDADGRALMSYESDQTFYSDYDARGLLTRHNTTFSVANTFDQNIVSRYYNGDGREVKRRKTIFAEDVNMTQPPYGAWTVEQPTYYIRSSVLGGESLTEVDHTGRKVKTNVIAAGAKIATQSQYTYNNTDHESVAFHHADAAAMSHRSTTGNGSVLWGDGQFDGGPAETDPLGGNMGLETPYVEPLLLPPPEEPNADWGFTPIDSDAPMIVNGQRVTCTLDGMAIGCAQAQRAMESGSAIPAALAMYQHLPGFNFTSQGLGIYTYTIPGYAFSTPNGTGNGDEIRVGSEGEHPDRVGSVFFNPAWTPRAQIIVERDDIIPLPDVRKGAEDLMKNRDCSNFIESLINQVATESNPFISDYFPNLAETVAVEFAVQTGRVDGQERRVAGRAYDRAPATGIAKVGISPSRIPLSGATEYGYANAIYDYVITFMHETIHLAGSKGRYTDRQLAEAAVKPRVVDGKPAYVLPEGALQEFNSLNPNSNGANSGFFDKLLKHFCPGPSALRRPTFR